MAMDAQPAPGNSPDGRPQRVDRSALHVDFLLGPLRFALPLDAVERVVRAVAITALPGAPAVILGVVVVGGAILPVADPRLRFGLPPRALAASDHMVIVGARRQRLVLLADAALGVRDYSGVRIVPSTDIAPTLPAIAGAAHTVDGVVLIQDIDHFLDIDEQHALQQALAHA